MQKKANKGPKTKGRRVLTDLALTDPEPRRVREGQQEDAKVEGSMIDPLDFSRKKGEEESIKKQYCIQCKKAPFENRMIFSGKKSNHSKASSRKGKKIRPEWPTTSCRH